MKIWLISDTHFGEQPIRRQRLCGMSGDEIDELIVRNWSERVIAKDHVWHLGDIGKNWRVLTHLPGVKHLIRAHASDRRPAIAKSGVFHSEQDSAELVNSNGSLLLVHDPDPFIGDPRRDIVHGHHHYRLPAPGRRSVCVDHIGWGPILLDDLLKVDC